MKTALFLMASVGALYTFKNLEAAGKSVRELPPTSCIAAVRALPEAQRDRILRGGLDKKIVTTLAGAVSQLSGRGDMSGHYGEYLNASLQWVENLQSELKKLSAMQAFLNLHQRRWMELDDLLHNSKIDLSKPIRLKSHIGNIDRNSRTATPTAPYATPVVRFGSSKGLWKEQRKTHNEIVLVRDEYGAETVTRIGLHRWILRKLYQEAGLEEQQAARKRVEDLKAANPKLKIDDLIKASRDSGSAATLLDVLYLSLEDPASWISDEKGNPNQAFTQELDGNFERLLNPFFDKIHDNPRRFVDRATGTLKKGYEGVTWIHKSWGTVKMVLGVGAIYTAILTLGSDAWNNTVALVNEYTTPDEVLTYNSQIDRERKRKIDIADKTIAAIADAENWEDAEKSFSEVLANYVRENAGDRAALLFSRFLKHYKDTGRSDWVPEAEEDKKRMAQVADLIALLNVQLFNEGPFPSADGTPQRFLSSAVVERWPWRSETEANLEEVMKFIRESNRVNSFPLPDGILPPSYMPAPAPNSQAAFEIAAQKIWDRHLSKGVTYVWDNRPVRWGLVLGLGVSGLWAFNRRMKLKDQYRLVPIEVD